MQGKANVLIVDDNIDMCRTMSLILRANGYNVDSAKDGTDAIEGVRQKQFDIVFMDIRMPRMNGVESYREIKKIRPETVVPTMVANREAVDGSEVDQIELEGVGRPVRIYRIEPKA